MSLNVMCRWGCYTRISFPLIVNIYSKNSPAKTVQNNWLSSSSMSNLHITEQYGPCVAHHPDVMSVAGNMVDLEALWGRWS